MTFRLSRLPRLAAVLTLLAVLWAGHPSSAAAMTDAEKAEIEALVRQYLINNPEVIAEAIDELQRRQMQAESEAQKAALTTSRATLERNPADPVGGNPKGDVTIVEFFDYQCGYCKKVFPAMMDVIDKDGKARLVFKEYPILGGVSVVASRAALAAKKQGKYMDFHNAVMGFKGQLSEDILWDLIKKAGLNVDRLKTDMNDESITKDLTANAELAHKLNISGTPGFVIGDQLIPGAIGPDQMKALIAMARETKG